MNSDYVNIVFIAGYVAAAFAIRGRGVVADYTTNRPVVFVHGADDPDSTEPPTSAWVITTHDTPGIVVIRGVEPDAARVCIDAGSDPDEIPAIPDRVHGVAATDGYFAVREKFGEIPDPFADTAVPAAVSLELSK